MTRALPRSIQSRVQPGFAARPRPLLRVLPLIGAGFALATLAACSTEPELRNQLTPELRNADYPPLLPVDELVPARPAPEQAGRAVEDTLQARSTALQRRADALRAATN